MTTDKALRDQIAEAIPVELTSTAAVGIGDARRLRIADAILPTVLARLAEVEAERDAARAETERVRARAVWAAIYRAGGRCRTCSGFEGAHLMSCRHYVGALEHVWEEWQSRLNPTFGGTDHYCRCGGSCRAGGLAGAIESGPPVCPNADQTHRTAAVDLYRSATSDHPSTTEEKP